MPADDHDPERWFNRPATIFAAGATAVVLVVVLIVAVMRTSDVNHDELRPTECSNHRPEHVAHTAAHVWRKHIDGGRDDHR